MNLEDVQIASPCKADWNKMTGDERVRFCHSCKLNVYNIAEMTRAEAEELLTPKDGCRLPCVQLWRRRDGTIITRDCPIGWRDRVEQMCVRAGTVASFIFAFLINSAGAQELHAEKGKVEPQKPINTNGFAQRGRVQLKGQPMKGVIVIPPTNTITGQVMMAPTEAVELNVSSSLVSRRGTWQEKHREGTRLAMDGIKPGHIDAGKVEQARRNLIAQGERADDLKFKQEAAISFNNAGNCALYLGKTDDALRLYERALTASCNSCDKDQLASVLSQNVESIITNILIAEEQGARKTELQKLDPRAAVLFEHLKSAHHARLVWIHTVNGGLSYTVAKRTKHSNRRQKSTATSMPVQATHND